MLLFLARLLAFAAGGAMVAFTLASAVRAFVLPRAARDGLTQWVFGAVRMLFGLRAKRVVSYGQRDEVMAFYAPVSLLSLPVVWLVIIAAGYALMFWGLGVDRFYTALKLSGSSLLTLGFEPVSGAARVLLAFSEAVIGLALMALLISYLPTIYASFSRREAIVTMLEMRVDTPPWGPQILVVSFKYISEERRYATWTQWEQWFVEVDESHSSQTALAYFRSPQPGRSWVTAAGAILDAAALHLAAVDSPREPQVYLSLTAGIDCLQHVSGALGISYKPVQYDSTGNPVLDPEALLSISRLEFDEALAHLERNGVPLKTDREQSWRVWSLWRSQYDAVLLALATLTVAPYAPWSSDRSLLGQDRQRARRPGAAGASKGEVRGQR